MAREDVSRKLPAIDEEIKHYRDQLKDALADHQAFDNERANDRENWKDKDLWLKAKQDVTKILALYKAAIADAIPGSKIKFRGSLASGWKGPHKVIKETNTAQRFNPREFDCDAFVEIPDPMWHKELVNTGILEDPTKPWAKLEQLRGWSRATALMSAQRQIIGQLRDIEGYQREDGEPHFELTVQTEGETLKKTLEGNVYPTGALSNAGASAMEGRLPDDRVRDGRQPGKRMPEENEEI